MEFQYSYSNGFALNVMVMVVSLLMSLILVLAMKDCTRCIFWGALAIQIGTVIGLGVFLWILVGIEK